MKFFLLLFFCTLQLAHASCLPLRFDHMYLTVSDDAYAQLGQSNYLSENRLSFFERFKNPFGNHRGHYMTGNDHYLEIFSQSERKQQMPFGIGFFVEKSGCLETIEKLLSFNFPNETTLYPKEEWGQWVEVKNNEVQVWASELNPKFMDSPNSNISIREYLNWIRKKNGDADTPVALQKMRQIRMECPKGTCANLARIFSILGWRVLELGNQDVHVSDGKTEIVLQKADEFRVREILFSLDNFKGPYKDAKFSEVFLSRSKDDLLWLVK